MIKLYIIFKNGPPAEYLMPKEGILDWTNVEHSEIDRIVIHPYETSK